MYEQLELAIEKRIAAEQDFYNCPGIALGVYVENKFELCLNKGKRTLNGESLQINDQFPLGSISKLYTAVLAMVLESKKILKITDSISRFLNVNWNGYEDKITIEMLLSHRSGLAFSRDHLSWRDQDFLNLDPSYFEFQPNEKYSESEIGFQILSVVLERATDKCIEELYKEYIFNPADLKESLGSVNNPSVDGHCPKSLPEVFGGDIIVLPKFNYSGCDGGIMTTVNDSCKFAKSILDSFDNKGPFANVDLKRLTKIQGKRGEDSFYSYGCWIKKFDFGCVLGHAGDLSGYQSCLLFNHEHGVIVSILCNGPGYPYGLGESIIKGIITKDIISIEKNVPAPKKSSLSRKIVLNNGNAILDPTAQTFINDGKTYNIFALDERYCQI